MSNTFHIYDTILGDLTTLFSAALQRAYPDVEAKNLVEITRSTQAAFGHYQCNSAMKLAKLVGQNPRVVADTLVKNIDAPELIEKLELAGPGFINIRIHPKFLEKKIEAIVTKPQLGITVSRKERIVIDFSSPNIAKEMHVGHLRSTIIGDSLARVFEFLGDSVLRLNHVGDWGTSFGMLIAYLKQYAKEALSKKETLSLPDLVAFYRESKKCFDEDEAFKKNAQKEVVALQSGEKEAVAIWQAICETSRRAYQEIYDLLDIRLIERGESFYNPELASTVADLEKKGLVTVSEGAKCIFLDTFQIPLMVQKSDGGYNYDTTDMAAIRQRIDVEKGTRLIYVTDAGQATHFQMIFKAAEKALYLDPKKVRCDHVPFGLVLGADGKKFRTRSGETERLIDLLLTAIDRAYAIVKERNPDWTEVEQKALAKALGINAVKYSDLSSHRVSDYVFSYDRMLRFEGNTAAFIMYAYVRVLGIQRKVGREPKKSAVTLTHPSEVALALHLARFEEALESVVQELLPNRLTDYLYELAETFNLFFRDCRVEGSPEEESRLVLTEATRKVLQQGMQLLGLSAVSRM